MVTFKEQVRSIRTKVTLSVIIFIGVLAVTGSIVGNVRIVPNQQIHAANLENIQDIQITNDDPNNEVKGGIDTEHNSRQLLKKRQRSRKNHGMHKSESGGRKPTKKRTKHVTENSNKIQMNGVKHLKTTGMKVVLSDELRGGHEPNRHHNGPLLDSENVGQDPSEYKKEKRVQEDYNTKLLSGNKPKQQRKHKVYVSKDVKNRSRTHLGQ